MRIRVNFTDKTYEIIGDIKDISVLEQSILIINRFPLDPERIYIPLINIRNMIELRKKI